MLVLEAQIKHQAYERSIFQPTFTSEDVGDMEILIGDNCLI